MSLSLQLRIRAGARAIGNTGGRSQVALPSANYAVAPDANREPFAPESIDMEPILLGYFPKRRTPTPPGMNLPGVQEIASVSECIANGPSDWVDLWTHNAAFVYDSPDMARQAIPVEDAAAYALYAYKLASSGFGPRNVDAIDTSVAPVSLSRSFVFLGYDVVGRDYATAFECSPLSCNLMATEVTVNMYCLIDELQQALVFAQRCGSEQPEPGEYVVVEVWRENV